MTTRYRIAEMLPQACGFLELDQARVLRRAGLPDDWMDQPKTDVEGERLFDIWSAIEAEDALPDTALRLAKSYAHGPFVPPVLAFSCAETVYIGWERLAIFKPLIAPMQMTVTRDGHAATLELVVALQNYDMSSCIEQFELIYLTECIRTYTGQTVTPLSVETNRPISPSQDLLAFFGVPPIQTGRTRLLMRPEDADLPLISRSPALWGTLEPEFTRQLEDASAVVPMATRVRRALLDGLPGGCTTAEEMARRLNVSKRSLQRRLAEEGTSFQALLNAIRANLSQRYLKDSNLSVPEISHLLGFRDTSSFFRAFQGWTGTTPGAFREGRKTPLH